MKISKNFVKENGVQVQRTMVAGTTDKWYFNVVIYQKYSVLGISMKRKLVEKTLTHHRVSNNPLQDGIDSTHMLAQEELLKEMKEKDWSIANDLERSALSF